MSDSKWNNSFEISSIEKFVTITFSISLWSHIQHWLYSNLWKLQIIQIPPFIYNRHTINKNDIRLVYKTKKQRNSPSPIERQKTNARHQMKVWNRCELFQNTDCFVYNSGQQIEYILHVYDFGQKGFYLFQSWILGRTFYADGGPIFWFYLTNWSDIYEHSYKLTDNMFRIRRCIVINVFMLLRGDGKGIKKLIIQVGNVSG